jgi:hypothetical protein
MSTPHQTPGGYLPAKGVQERYGIVDRTLDRWLADTEMDFPRPLVVRGRRYFRETELVAWERRRAATAA